jgi:Raf kinase inhibitor-like YbhB/YbcL family protein
MNELGGCMKLTSAAFAHGKGIPVKYTCSGLGINPPLAIADQPAGTRSLALVMDDPDAPSGTFIHWLLWNIPPGAKEIKEGSRNIGPEGVTDARRVGYAPPCPPPGPPHTYRFKIFALDTPLDLKAGANRAQLEKAMRGHILAQAELDGEFGR